MSCILCRIASDVDEGVELDQGLAFAFAFARNLENAAEFLCGEHEEAVGIMSERMDSVHRRYHGDGGGVDASQEEQKVEHRDARGQAEVEDDGGA